MLHQLPTVAAHLAPEHPVIRQPFMSRAMWFAWLLRGDIRGGAGLGNAEAQRDFVVWWLLRGPCEYPLAWSIAAPQIEVAMEPVFAAPGVRLPRLLRALHRQRGDLRAAFALDEPGAVANFLCWYRVHGAKDLAITPELPPLFKEMTEAPTDAAPWCDDPQPVPRLAVWSYRASVALRARFDAGTAAGRRQFCQWFAAEGAAALPAARLALPPAKMPTRVVAPPLREPEFGVNLVGYPRGEFGIGEDIRMLSLALDRAEVPHVVIDLGHGSQARQLDGTLEDRIVPRMRYGVTVFCQSTFDTARIYLEYGPALFAGRVNIGNWPWELERFPSFWGEVYDLVDEVWAASRFTHAAYAADIGGRARLMPPAVALDEARVRPAAVATTRAKAGKPFVFVCPFDPNSYPERKNPVAAIRAFRAAFPRGGEAVRLIVRANGVLRGRPEWHNFHDAAGGDDRIEIIEGTAPRIEYLADVERSGCLISSHRAEGFGRNIAEAILLGVPVLATGYSGCTDFLAENERIAFAARQLGPDDYPYAAFMVWADPDVADLARHMREVVTAPRPRPDRAEAIRAEYGPAVAGARYRTRLTEIFDRAFAPEFTVAAA